MMFNVEFINLPVFSFTVLILALIIKGGFDRVGSDLCFFNCQLVTLGKLLICLIFPFPIYKMRIIIIHSSSVVRFK